MSDDYENLNKEKNTEKDIIPKDTENLIKEAELSLKENQNQFKIGISKINNLIKKRYSLYENDQTKSKNILDIRKFALEINSNAKEQKLQTENLIKGQEIQIKKLNNEKVLFERNQIQLDIVKNQKMLIDNYKDKNDQLKSELNQLNNKMKDYENSNQKFLASNKELKETISRYINHNKNLQISIDKFKLIQSESLLDKSRIKEMLNQIKFYQEDNVRLSSEIIEIQKKYEIIKENFNLSESEKNDIFKQIQELNNSLAKTNIIGTPFVKEKVIEDSINSKALNDISDINLENDKKDTVINKDLDNEINDIFK